MTRARRTLIVLLAPLVLAAGDPSGDVASCPSVAGRPGGDAPDLVEATSQIVELGTSVRFTLRFAEPLQVPDGDGKPFRVDIVVFDPGVPAIDAGLYRHVNRILRYDAVRDPVTTTLLLPEAGQSRFIPPAIEGDTLMMQVPGRTLTADEDETGASPGLDRLRWGVVVRDEGVCDLLGGGRPTERMRAVADGASAQTVEDVAVVQPDRRPIGVAMVAVAALAVAYLARRRARNPR